MAERHHPLCQQCPHSCKQYHYVKIISCQLIKERKVRAKGKAASVK